MRTKAEVFTGHEWEFKVQLLDVALVYLNPEMIMFAYVSCAGGCYEFRLSNSDNGLITVTRWVLDTTEGSLTSGGMIPDRNHKEQIYKDTLRAMIAIAEAIS